jgi:phosphoribosylaminoimidazole-succinocarboxamide synthase
MTRTPLLTSDLPGYTVRRGKVRDVYDLGETLLLVSTDRISAFDWILPSGIPDKGQVLTQLSAWWFERSDTEHQVLSTHFADFGLPAEFEQQLAGRSTLVRKTTVVPIECVVRGYLVGSGWKEYCQTQSVCGIKLPTGLRDGDRLPEPIFTPATKAESGHDENISYEQMVEYVGADTAEELRTRSLDLYRRGSDLALGRGIIIADTKFEWGRTNEGRIILIDEVLTPDSSRFWPANEHRPGQVQPSFDKQFVRNWLEQSGWDKNSPPPELPAEIIAQTRARYIEAYERLTGEDFAPASG